MMDLTAALPQVSVVFRISPCPMDRSIPIALTLTTFAVRAFLIAAQVHLYFWLRRTLRGRGVTSAGWIAAVAATVGAGLILYGDMFQLDVRLTGIPRREPSALRYGADVWTATVSVAYALLLALGFCSRGRRNEYLESPQRRRMLQTAASAAVAGPLAVAGYGAYIGRTRFEVRETEIVIPGLPKDLEGLKIAQLTDMHAGPFLTPRELETAVAMANETRPHIAVITGDLITQEGDPLDDALDALANLKADAGIWGCMGNHESYARCLSYAANYGARRGMRFLRQDAETLRFGDSLLNLAGVDYQRRGRAYLEGAGGLINPAATNLLLSHNPDVFPEAEALGYDLVVAGHTHGGQVTVEIVEQTVNAGHFFTPYVVGQYRLNDSALYVSRGLGCVNLPMRIGAWPEISLLKLVSG